MSVGLFTNFIFQYSCKFLELCPSGIVITRINTFSTARTRSFNNYAVIWQKNLLHFFEKLEIFISS